MISLSFYSSLVRVSPDGTVVPALLDSVSRTTGPRTSTGGRNAQCLRETELPSYKTLP